MSTNTFSVKDIMSVSCALFRQQGFVKKTDSTRDESVLANSTLLYRHFFDHADETDSKRVDVQDRDIAFAEEVIEYLKGLSFKTMERGLTSFETNVLKFVTAESADKSTLGIAASLPNVYQNKLDQDAWEIRERELAETSEYVGEYRSRGEFEVAVENVRYIGRTGSYLYCTSVDNKHILKFFSQDELGGVGTRICLSAYVKSHSESKYHGGKETMVNRVKVHSVNP